MHATTIATYVFAAMTATVAAMPAADDSQQLTSTKVEDKGTQDLKAAAEGCVVQLFSGGNCDGYAGSQDPVNKCLWADEDPSRHSYRIGDGCGTQDVYLHTQHDCGDNTNMIHQVHGPGCYGVNTGRNWAAVWFKPQQ